MQDSIHLWECLRACESLSSLLFKPNAHVHTSSFPFHSPSGRSNLTISEVHFPKCSRNENYFYPLSTISHHFCLLSTPWFFALHSQIHNPPYSAWWWGVSKLSASGMFFSLCLETPLRQTFFFLIEHKTNLDDLKIFLKTYLLINKNGCCLLKILTQYSLLFFCNYYKIYLMNNI